MTDLTAREQIPCPLCNNASFRVAYRLNSWQIVKCDACAFAYVNPRLNKEQLYSIYTENYFDNPAVGYLHYKENSRLRIQNFNRWLNDAKPFYPDTVKSALDIGCAAGYCLDLFRAKGWDASGVELDKSFAVQLREKGFQIYDRPFLQITFERRFQVITLFDVIEHLTDLHEHFRKLNTILDEQGIVILITPDYASRQRKLFGKKWFQFKPAEHINYFTISDLERLAADNGFDMLHHEKAGQYSDAAFLNDRLGKYGFGFAKPLLNLGLSLFGRREKSMYVDTASLYVVMRKRAS